MTMHVAVAGAGPAGLMAADVVSAAGVAVTVYERMPSVGRKFLMAGRGGLNLTHSEPLERFLDRYGSARDSLAPAIRAFHPAELRAFAHALGEDTFVGSSGRVFPRTMKASPLLRAWLEKLRRQGVVFRTRHEIAGIDGQGHLLVAGPGEEPRAVAADAAVLALGGGSWARLGSDGGWVDWLSARGVGVTPLAASNVGVSIPWSAHLRDRFEGTPVKRVAVGAGGSRARGELVVTRTGLEGGAIYALGPVIRAALARDGQCRISIDLRPDLEAADIEARLARPRGKLSLSAWLGKVIKLPPVAIALLREQWGRELPSDAAGLARAIKAVTLDAVATGPIDRAISTAGGVALGEVDTDLMLKALPGVFVAGEMLDWEAPTGGYLLQACFATGHAAGHGVLRYFGIQSCASPRPSPPSGPSKAET